MSHPRVREEINRAVSGDPEVWPISWFRREMSGRLPFERALSIGSGIGNLERDLVRQEIVGEVTGIEITEAPLREAERLAFESGLSDRISYVREDARQVLREESDLDAIFFHASLHHFDRLDELMELVRGALRPDGVLYRDEYIGPSMSQWNALRLLPANLAYYLLPRRIRRPWLVRTPLNPEDPTEAIASAEIVPALERRFEILRRRDYGGNLLSLIYPNLHRHDAVRGDLDRAIERLLRLERRLFRRFGSYHAVIVARPTC